jgi:hypothetical protein
MAEHVRLPRRRRYGVRALFVAATILAVAGIFAVFANRQLLNADNWANTSSALLDDQNVRTQISDFLVDQVYSNVDVQAQIAGALPPRLQRLSGPAANGLQTLAENRTEKLLGRPRVQEAWKTANKLTAQQFIAIAKGNSRAITQSGNAVVLDLRVVLLDLVRRLGLPGTLAGKIPPSAGRIKVMSGNQIQTLQNGASAVNGLSLVLPALSLLCLALAVYLARGRRRETLLGSGICLIIAGAVVLIGRNVAGGAVVDSLAKTDAVRPAAEAVWATGTGMLHDVAQATIVGGIPLIIAAWLAGPTKLAMGFRRNAAPWLRERPGVTYGVVAALVLLIIAWGPIPATRKLIPVLIMIGLVIIGVEALRRQVTEEYPTSTEEDVKASLRAAIASARGRNGHRTTPAPAADRLVSLERLSALHDSGALNDEEFAAEKAALKGGPPVPA